MRPDFSTNEVKGFFSKKTGKIKYLKEKIIAIVLILLMTGLVFMVVCPKTKEKTHAVSTASALDDMLSFISASHIDTLALADNDLDGFNTKKDCDDNNPSVNPSARENCNDQIDNNCDGNLNEGCPGLPKDKVEDATDPVKVNPVTYYYDGDGDGHGAGSPTVSSVALSGPYVKIVGDCDDNNRAVYPGAKEDCNDKLDNNCDGNVNEGCVISPTSFNVNGSNVSWLQGPNILKLRVTIKKKDGTLLPIESIMTRNGNWVLSKKDYSNLKASLRKTSGRLEYYDNGQWIDSGVDADCSQFDHQ
jgi:hypothetical protein